MEALEWNDMEDTDVYVIGLKDGNIRHLTTQPMYSLHHANAYQLNKVIFNHFVKHCLKQISMRANSKN